PACRGAAPSRMDRAPSAWCAPHSWRINAPDGEKQRAPRRQSPDFSGSRAVISIGSPSMSELQPAPEEHLYERIAAILDEARSRVARSINTAMVHAYWLIGWELVEVEQHGAERAGYGEGLMKRVATRLSAKFGKGFSLASLKRLKQFYLAFPRGSA